MTSRARNGSSPSLPVCGYVFDGLECEETGEHFCEPRARRAVAFVQEIAVHTKGQWARRPFILEPWQRDEIVRPLFGRTVWSEQWACYVRRYSIAWIRLGRKNGKSQICAAIALLLTIGDDEEGAEVYGCAKDTPQARKVWDVAERMRNLQAPLRNRLKVNKQEKRLYDERTASYYQVITADAAGELGHNPHGTVMDETEVQASGALWDAMRTAMGTRRQPLLVGIGTAGNDPSSWAATMDAEMQRVAEQPSRAPHVFVYIREVPREADPWDEGNWQLGNPALGTFLSWEALRQEALEARNDPTKENAFRQFRLNQWVSQTTRWMPLHIWDTCGGLVAVDKLKGKRCFGGLDLSSTTDLTALCWLFPDEGMQVVWRFFVPEAQVPVLDQYLGGKASVWVKQGWLRATEGDVIDYQALYTQAERDKADFKVVDVSYDRWSASSAVQELESRGLEMVPVPQGYGLSPALKEIMRLVKGGSLNHGGNPVARWHADSAEVRQDDQENIRVVKPERNTSGRRIDGIAALGDAVDGWMRRGRAKRKYRAAGF